MSPDNSVQMTGPTREFWHERFVTHHTPWDRGAANPQLKHWLDSKALEPCRILVPGCGSGYEVAVLAERGFEVTALDYAPAAVALTRERLEHMNARATGVEADVLAWEATVPFDAIYEQTCVCALHPDHWVRYAHRVDRWITSAGKLFALFMQALRPGAGEGSIQGPPYHCDINAMRALFAETTWRWPAPPYPRVPHSGTWFELAVVLEHRPGSGVSYAAASS